MSDWGSSDATAMCTATPPDGQAGTRASGSSGPSRFGLILVGLALVVGLGIGSSRPGLGADDIEILDDPRPVPAEKIDLGRSFGTAPCASRPPGRTVLGKVLADADRILVHQFDARRWRDLAAVKAYVGRLLSAEPEGGALSPGVYWAELRHGEILASVQFSNGQRGLLHLANGYAHVQDSSGCEWWARYLGPDRARWIVWP